MPDDDMLKAFVADTMRTEEEQGSSHTCPSSVGASERNPGAETPKAPGMNPSSRLLGAEPVFGTVLKWGLLILAVLFIWFVLSK